ncbi:MAG TPA: hypothetical protein VHK28_08110 [Candidatus Limnocylindria bacterium]|nr:hypothetical protein [Candidatus Limnocylindria bacterium]
MIVPAFRRTVLLSLVTLALAACTASSPSASVPAEPSPSADVASAEPSSEPSAPASQSAAPSADPSEDLGEFACELPVSGVGNLGLAHLLDVRVGEHEDFDRIVFEFDEGIPRFTLESAEPPFTEDASGLPLEVEGNQFLSLRLEGGTKQGEGGEATYDGPTEFEPDFSALVHLVEGGDFEAQSTWYIGMESDACMRVTSLPAPNRLVIDIQH